jgi:hypothetical protein
LRQLAAALANWRKHAGERRKRDVMSGVTVSAAADSIFVRRMPATRATTTALPGLIERVLRFGQTVVGL